MKIKLYTTCKFLLYIVISCFFVNESFAVKIDTDVSVTKASLDKQYVQLIRDWSRELKKDGRAGKIYEIASSIIDEKSSCEVCNEFFQKLMIFCTINKAVAEKNKKNNKIETMQREPSLMVVHLAITLFNMLANDEKLSDDATKISMLLSYSLKNYSPMTKGEQEYYGMLVEYIEAPFKDKTERMPSVAEKSNKDEVLKHLFEY